MFFNLYILVFVQELHTRDWPTEGGEPCCKRLFKPIFFYQLDSLLHFARKKKKALPAVLHTTTDGSICSVVEPIFFSKVFWSTLGEARWVEILRKTCKTFARAGDHSNRDSMGSTATHAVDKWEDFALDSVLDFASHLAYVRSIHALFLPTSTGKALLDEESCNARKIAMAG